MEPSVGKMDHPANNLIYYVKDQELNLTICVIILKHIYKILQNFSVTGQRLLGPLVVIKSYKELFIQV